MCVSCLGECTAVHALNRRAYHVILPACRERTSLSVDRIKEETPLRLSYERCRVFLLAGVLVCGAATSLAQTETTPGPSTPGQQIPGTTGVSPFAASVPAKLVPGVLSLSFQDAIDRGLKQNLGLLLSHADVRAARGRALAAIECSLATRDRGALCGSVKRLTSMNSALPASPKLLHPAVGGPVFLL